ncbi:DUF6746 family protein [Aromatoleum bremense]|uniref:DUF6746 family protein n=1 Tax=Aromatoleum bremense TaxID=76115 RepID=UPI0031407FE4
MLKGNVSDAAMADVHELTYTLENALGKMNEELTKLAETLERVMNLLPVPARTRPWAA